MKKATKSQKRTSIGERTSSVSAPRNARLTQNKQVAFWKSLYGTEVSDAEFRTVQDFGKLNEKDKISAARKIIQATIIDAAELPGPVVPFALAASEDLLPGYTTLDDPHRSEIRRVISDISSYLGDPSRKRPLNCLMLAAPGAGKSHFIKQLAAKMEPQRVQSVTFNMATMQNNDDMAPPIDELRNLKVNDRFPLLFLDEFDSDASRYAGLLPLLWDGELHVGHRDLKLGKAVIVLAGSHPDLPKVMDRSAKMQLEDDSASDGVKSTGKLIDLLSRINGGIINIPDLDLRTENRDRRVDKVCVAIALLKVRFGGELFQMPRMLLRFIADTKFRYGVRSIAHLIDIIDSAAFRQNSLKGNSLRLPLTNETALRESSLKLHVLDKDQAFGVVNRWKQMSKDRVVVNIRPRAFFPNSFRDGNFKFRIV